VGGSGVGRFTLAVDGDTVLDTRLELPPGADPVEGMMRPPQATHAVPLQAGQAVRLVLRHDVEAPQGASFATESVGFQLLLDPPRPAPADALEDAARLAAEADVAVVVVGTTPEVESEGFDRESLALPGDQDELVRRVAAANPRTVVVVNAGAPVLLPWADEVPAVLLAWFPGQEFGAALADVLLGTAEPGGRLPTTWPASEDGLPSVRPENGVLPYDEGLAVGHRSDRPARFAFGHGLGYTEWEYLDMAARAAEDVDVRVRVRNRGPRPGREVVQVYASRPGGPVRHWLAGFAAVELGPGEEAEVDVAVPARSLAAWDPEAHAWRTPPGSVRLAAGRSSAELRVTADIDVPAA
jgi:beta-glucosidase